MNMKLCWECSRCCWSLLEAEDGSRNEEVPLQGQNRPELQPSAGYKATRKIDKGRSEYSMRPRVPDGSHMFVVHRNTLDTGMPGMVNSEHRAELVRLVVRVPALRTRIAHTAEPSSAAVLLVRIQ